MIPFRRFLAISIIAALFLGWNSVGHAAFKIKIETTGFGTGDTSVVVEDQALLDGFKDPTQAGTISYIAQVGSLNVLMTIGSSKPATAPNGGSLARIVLDTFEFNNMVSGQAGTIKVSITDTDFELQPVTDVVNYQLMNGGNLTNATGTLQLNVDSGNTEFSSSGFEVGPLDLNQNASGSTPMAIPNPFSITLVQTIHVNAGFSQGSMDSQVDVYVPEPASAGIWFVGFVAAMIGSRIVRRR